MLTIAIQPKRYKTNEFWRRQRTINGIHTTLFWTYQNHDFVHIQEQSNNLLISNNALDVVAMVSLRMHGDFCSHFNAVIHGADQVTLPFGLLWVLYTRDEKEKTVSNSAYHTCKEIINNEDICLLLNFYYETKCINHARKSEIIIMQWLS